MVARDLVRTFFTLQKLILKNCLVMDCQNCIVLVAKKKTLIWDCLIWQSFFKSPMPSFNINVLGTKYQSTLSTGAQRPGQCALIVPLDNNVKVIGMTWNPVVKASDLTALLLQEPCSFIVPYYMYHYSNITAIKVSANEAHD